MMVKYTKYFIGLFVLVALGYDAFVLVKEGTEASISHVILVWSYKYPLVTFAAGFLSGHLFWRIRDTKKTEDLGGK